MSDSVEAVAALGGEVITYLSAGGTAKQFKAIVERRPSQVAGSPAGSYPVNTLEVSFPMDAVNGVLTVLPRKDAMRFKKNVSDSQETEFSVQKIVEEDTGLAGSGGMFRILVQA